MKSFDYDSECSGAVVLILVFPRYPSDTGKYDLQMHEEEKRRFSLVKFYERHFEDCLIESSQFFGGRFYKRRKLRLRGMID